MLIDYYSKNELKKLFLAVCDELESKNKAKEKYFEDLKREVLEYPHFNILVNLCDLLANYYDLLDRETILQFIRTVQSLQGIGKKF